MTELIKPPYYEHFKAAMGPDGEFDEWSGLYAPMTVTSIEEEAKVYRSGAAALDLTPMNKYRITGKDAGAFLDYMMTRKISTMKDYRVAYVLWANENGKLLDDGTVFRFNASDYMIKCGEDQTEHLEKISKGFDITISNQSADYSGLSIQGPKAYALLLAAGAKAIDDLKAFQFAYTVIGGEAVYISRTGFTGDLGYEIWAKSDQSDAIWRALSNTSIKMTPTGLNALDTVRVECGYIVPGVDFGLPGCDADFERSAAEMGLNWLVNIDREEDFVGKAAIINEHETNSSRYAFVGIELDDRSFTGPGSLYEMPIFSGDEKIGVVTSGGYSYTLEKNIGVASVKIGKDKVGAKITIGEGKKPASIVDIPFFSTDRRTQTPPAK